MALDNINQEPRASLTSELSDLSCKETIRDFPAPQKPVGQQLPYSPLDAVNVPPVRSLEDQTLINDDRVLQNLLRLEEKYLPSAPDYFRFVQKDIVPSMRKIVADWLQQVVEELRCQPEVFCLAMNYMDRFLARCRVTKGKLQLIGSVCLLLSSKFKETNPVHGESLIYYSDFSVRSDEMRVS